MARQQPKHAKLVEYLGRAYEKEREIESALGAQIVMATRPGYQKRLESHLRDTKVRTEKLQKRLRELGAPNGGAPARGAARDAKAAAKTVTDRATKLAKAPAGAMGADPEADKLLENARGQLAGAGEQVANYRIVRSLARAAGDKPTRRLARDFRRQHEELGEYVAKAIPKLSRAVARQEEAEAPARPSGGGRRRSGTGAKRSSGAAKRRSRASSSGARSGSGGSAGRSRGSSTRGKSSAAATGRSRTSAARGRSKSAATSSRSRSSSARGKRTAASSKPTASGRSSSSGAKSSRSAARGGARKPAAKARSGTRKAATKA